MSFSHIPFFISSLVFLVTFCNLSEFHPVDKWQSANLTTVMSVASHWRRTWWQCHYHDPKVQQPWRVMRVNSVRFSATCRLKMTQASIVDDDGELLRVNLMNVQVGLHSFKRFQESFWTLLLHIRKTMKVTGIAKTFEIFWYEMSSNCKVNPHLPESAETAPWQKHSYFFVKAWI